MAKAGRKKIDIDADEVEKLAEMQCTNDEIAAFFDVSKDTIERHFAATIKRCRQKGVTSMKRQLFKKVQDGDLGAIVWWSKNFAGMSDKIESKVKSETDVTYKIGWSDEDEYGNFIPATKNVTPIQDPEKPKEIQESGVGKTIGEDD